MFRSLASRVVAPRLTATPLSHLATSHQSAASRVAPLRSFATATASPTADYSTPPEFQLTAEQKNQSDWEQWDQAKMNVYVLGSVAGGILLVNYWSANTRPPHLTTTPSQPTFHHW